MGTAFVKEITSLQAGQHFNASISDKSRLRAQAARIARQTGNRFVVHKDTSTGLNSLVRCVRTK